MEVFGLVGNECGMVGLGVFFPHSTPPGPRRDLGPPTHHTTVRVFFFFFFFVVVFFFFLALPFLSLGSSEISTLSCVMLHVGVTRTPPPGAPPPPVAQLIAPTRKHTHAYADTFAPCDTHTTSGVCSSSCLFFLVSVSQKSP